MKDKLQDVLDKLKEGDIVLVRGKKFVAKSIRFFMDRLRKKMGIEKQILFNHAATVISYKGTWYVAEANGVGVEASPFVEAYGHRLDSIRIISPKKPYSKIEKNKIVDVALDYIFQPTRYDFFGLFHQIRMIRNTRKRSVSNKRPWRGPEGLKAQRRLYCTEAVATWANEVRPNTFQEPWSVNPLHVMLNKYYKIIYDGTKEEG